MECNITWSRSYPIQQYSKPKDWSSYKKPVLSVKAPNQARAFLWNRVEREVHHNADVPSIIRRTLHAKDQSWLNSFTITKKSFSKDIIENFWIFNIHGKKETANIHRIYGTFYSLELQWITSKIFLINSLYNLMCTFRKCTNAIGKGCKAYIGRCTILNYALLFMPIMSM